MWLSFLLILPEFLLILLGSLIGRISVFTRDFWAALEKMVFYVLFPPLIFLSIVKAKISLEAASYFLLVSICAMLTAVVSAWLVNFLLKEDQWTKWSIFHCGFRFNTYIGFAVCNQLLGAEGLALLSLLIAVWVPISNVIATLGLIRAASYKDSVQSQKLSKAVKAVATNPLIVATLAGLVFKLTNLDVPFVIEEILKPLGNASLALGLLCIGANLKLSDCHHYRSLVLLGSFQRLIIVPCICIGVVLVCHLISVEASVLVLFGALPTAQSCYVMTAAMKGNAVAVADLTSTQTLFSLITLPLWLSAITAYFL